MFFDLFTFEFMQRAFLAGSVVGLIAPIIGMFLVVRRYSYLADTLAHVSLLGITFGILFRIPPVGAAALTTVSAALIIEHIREKGKLWGDSLLSLLLSGSLAVALVLMSLTNASGIRVTSILFGSITTLTSFDVGLIGVLGFLVLIILAFLYHSLFIISFHEALARGEGVSVSLVNRVFVILASLTVAISLQTLGVLLVGALMTIPVITATLLNRGFRQTMYWSIAISLLSVWVGLVGSYLLNTPSGASIVTVLLCCFVSVFLLRTVLFRAR